MAAPKTQARQTEPADSTSWATSAVFSALVALACVVIHLFVTNDASHDLERQIEKRTILREQYRHQENEAIRLGVLDNALETDPQTIERGLRLAGMGRGGDRVLHVVNNERR